MSVHNLMASYVTPKLKSVSKETNSNDLTSNVDYQDMCATRTNLEQCEDVTFFPLGTGFLVLFFICVC